MLGILHSLLSQIAMAYMKSFGVHCVVRPFTATTILAATTAAPTLSTTTVLTSAPVLPTP